MTRMQDQKASRPAFTLVELLAVMAIIAILVALSGAAFFYFTYSTPAKTTQSKIMAIDEIFRARWNKVIADAKKETPLPKSVYDLAGGSDQSARAKVIWIKCRLAEAFPMTYAEVQTPWVYTTGLIPANMRKPCNTAYRKTLGTLNAANNPATESAACLLMALTVDFGGMPSLPDLARYTKDTDGDGIAELVDDWGLPLYFYRFPTDNSDLQSAAPQAGAAKTNRDPLDQQGTLNNTGWYNSPYGTTTCGAFYEANFHMIKSQGTVLYTVPVIVSAGLDNKLGLNLPSSGASAMGIANAPDVTDNIYNFKLNVGINTKS